MGGERKLRLQEDDNWVLILFKGDSLVETPAKRDCTRLYLYLAHQVSISPASSYLLPSFSFHFDTIFPPLTILQVKMPKNSGSSSSSRRPGEGERDRRRRKSSGVSSTNQLATAQAVIFHQFLLHFNTFFSRNFNGKLRIPPHFCRLGVILFCNFMRQCKVALNVPSNSMKKAACLPALIPMVPWISSQL